MLLATSFIAANVCGQSLTTITEYYDYFRTRVKRVYTVLPNNKTHGTEKGYLQAREIFKQKEHSGLLHIPWIPSWHRLHHMLLRTSRRRMRAP